ncbi:hypothetical protein HDV05_001251 [Chytridiales sp. JEL 0842]|nr:hypothetical protein HDV05_001251 [Chytridiales sp. JEL 0842]
MPPSWISPLTLTPTRLSLAQSLRAKLFNKPPPTPTPVPKPPKPTPSVALKMKNYYPPDIDFQALAMQDPELKKLGLKDLKLEERLEKEREWEKRGKIVRVSALTGRRKKVEGEGKGGKKKRK